MKPLSSRVTPSVSMAICAAVSSAALAASIWIAVLPMRITSPGASGLRRISRPLRNVPLRLPLSTSTKPSGPRRISAWRLDAPPSVNTMSLVSRRPRVVSFSKTTTERPF